MKVRQYKDQQAGVAVLEAILLLAIVAILVAVGIFVFHQKHTADATLASSRSSDDNAPLGTTASINQITQREANAEKSVDNSADLKIAALRQAANVQLQASFSKMMAKATTGLQQNAVKAYETSVDNALSSRQAAYDAARQTQSATARDAAYKVADQAFEASLQTANQTLDKS